jgi:Family of unknown function (DUF6445)
MKIETISIGQDLGQIVIIDEFTGDPSALVDDAAMLSFDLEGEYYPGIRANVHPALAAKFVRQVEPILEQIFHIALPPDHVDCWYSLVTTPPERLAPIQRLPHFDSTDPGRIALLHYLSPHGCGGTAFFRHRSTGLCAVFDDRLASYEAALRADIAANGMPGAAYISGDTPIFEEIFRVEGRYNRAVLYRGNMLHCGHIPENLNLSADPRLGRLTINSFIHGRCA